jgi:hypothetical protein
MAEISRDRGALSKMEGVFGSMGGGFPIHKRIAVDSSFAAVSPQVWTRVGGVGGGGE